MVLHWLPTLWRGNMCSNIVWIGWVLFLDGVFLNSCWEILIGSRIGQHWLHANLTCSHKLLLLWSALLLRMWCAASLNFVWFIWLCTLRWLRWCRKEPHSCQMWRVALQVSFYLHSVACLSALASRNWSIIRLLSIGLKTSTDLHFGGFSLSCNLLSLSILTSMSLIEEKRHFFGLRSGVRLTSLSQIFGGGSGASRIWRTGLLLVWALFAVLL